MHATFNRPTVLFSTTHLLWLSVTSIVVADRHLLLQGAVRAVHLAHEPLEVNFVVADDDGLVQARDDAPAGGGVDAEAVVVEHPLDVLNEQLLALTMDGGIGSCSRGHTPVDSLSGERVCCGIEAAGGAGGAELSAWRQSPPSQPPGEVRCGDGEPQANRSRRGSDTSSASGPGLPAAGAEPGRVGQRRAAAWGAADHRLHRPIGPPPQVRARQILPLPAPPASIRGECPTTGAPRRSRTRRRARGSSHRSTFAKSPRRGSALPTWVRTAAQ